MSHLSEDGLEACCAICNDIITTDRGSIQDAGAQTIIKISEELGDGVADKISVGSFPIPIHATCRRKYTAPSSIKSAKKHKIDDTCTCSIKDDGSTSRSKTKAYNQYTDCCLCGFVIQKFKNCSTQCISSQNNHFPQRTCGK